MTSQNPTPDRRWYRFGPYVVDAQKHLLWREGVLVPLTSKAFEILLLLIQKRGHVVDKQELLDTVWPRTAVEENTLTRHVSTLRKALEERPDQHNYILTVPGYGYQFVAEVGELDQRPDHLQHRAQFVVEAHVPPLPEAAALAPPDSPKLVARRSASMALLATALVVIVVGVTLVVAVLRMEPAAGSMPQRELRQVTFHGGLQTDPTWSPDGKRVAYASTHAGNSDIWVQAIGDPSPVQITTAAAEESQPDWSPDGQWLVFRSERDGGGLDVVSAWGGTPRRISPFGYGPRWSPSGALILFSSSGHPGGTPRFHVVGLDGRPPQPLRPDLLQDFSPLFAAWRGDDRTFSIWGRHATDGWTFLTAPVHEGPPIRSKIATAVEKRREEAELSLGRFVWSRSGGHLYFEGRAHETQNLWRVTVDPKTLAWVNGPDRLTMGATQDADAVVSADGTRLVFSARTVRTRLWMFPFDAATGKITGAGQPVTSGGAGEQDADAPDDGSKLVYRTVRGGTQQLWERNVVDGQERLLVRGDQWTRTRPRWSSDGRRLSYLRRRSTSGGGPADGSVVVFSVDRGEERLLTTPGAPHIIPSDWSADGRWVLGGCPQQPTRRVATCAIEVPDDNKPATVRLLAADGTHNLFEQRFSPDQRWISFIAVNASDAGVSTIFVMPAAGGSWKAITDGTAYDDKPHWAPDGRTIYFVSPRNGALNVWGRRFDAADGTPSGHAFQITSFNTPRQMISGQLAQMQIALTTNRLFLPITEIQSELWMLQGVDR
jgi:Tol biopolymer transport system component/DNA-binding winged helix-turn-helix (wHTH) protein